MDWDVRFELELEAGQGPGAVRAQNNGEEIVEAGMLQRSWSLRPSWRPSSIFEMELVVYESATKLKALEFNRRKRREHRWRHAVAERVMVAAVRMARFFTDTRDGALEHAREM